MSSRSSRPQEQSNRSYNATSSTPFYYATNVLAVFERTFLVMRIYIYIRVGFRRNNAIGRNTEMSVYVCFGRRRTNSRVVGANPLRVTISHATLRRFIWIIRKNERRPRRPLHASDGYCFQVCVVTRVENHHRRSNVLLFIVFMSRPHPNFTFSIKRDYTSLRSRGLNIDLSTIHFVLSARVAN